MSSQTESLTKYKPEGSKSNNLPEEYLHSAILETIFIDLKFMIPFVKCSFWKGKTVKIEKLLINTSTCIFCYNKGYKVDEMRNRRNSLVSDLEIKNLNRICKFAGISTSWFIKVLRSDFQNKTGYDLFIEGV